MVPAQMVRMVAVLALTPVSMETVIVEKVMAVHQLLLQLTTSHLMQLQLTTKARTNHCNRRQRAVATEARTNSHHRRQLLVATMVNKPALVHRMLVPVVTLPLMQIQAMPLHQMQAMPLHQMQVATEARASRQHRPQGPLATTVTKPALVHRMLLPVVTLPRRLLKLASRRVELRRKPSCSLQRTSCP